MKVNQNNYMETNRNECHLNEGVIIFYGDEVELMVISILSIFSCDGFECSRTFYTHFY